MTATEMTNDEVGPIIRQGEIADAVLDAIIEDNPDKEVQVIDRGDYIRIHTDRLCRLTQASLEKHLGREYRISGLEAEMPAFSGRMRTTHNEFVWYLEN